MGIRRKWVGGAVAGVFALAMAVGQASAETTRVVHVYVALADNAHQGIVPVPAKLGDGDAPATNLYWGAAFGVKTFFRASAEWKTISCGAGPKAVILERCVFVNREHDVYLVADAYRGSEIRQAVTDFLSAAAGLNGETLRIGASGVWLQGLKPKSVPASYGGVPGFTGTGSTPPLQLKPELGCAPYDGVPGFTGTSSTPPLQPLLAPVPWREAAGNDQRTESVEIAGGADLVAYVGHDAFMDFSIAAISSTKGDKARAAIILACASKQFFGSYLRATGAEPLLWTTGLMAPEAYTLKAALDGWMAGEDAGKIRERAAEAYDRYQHCGMRAARRLFDAGW